MKKLRPLAALALVALISSGCGSNAPSETETGTTSSSGTARGASTASSAGGTGASTKLTARDRAVKFAECIRAHGVSDFPDPNSSNEFEYGVSVSPAVWQRATAACKSLQPPGALSAKRTPKQQAASLRFAQCIRDNGVKDFPDPVNGQPLVDTNRIPSTNTAGGMTILNAAMQKCHDVLGLPAGGRG